LESSGQELRDRVEPEDVVIVHDPQPAGLIPAAKVAESTCVWRCHIGIDDPNEVARSTWDFLRPFVEQADATVFSRKAYVWSGLDERRVEVIMPSIDAFSPKNQTIEPDVGSAILREAGILPRGKEGRSEFVRPDGTTGTVGRKVEMIEDEPVDPSVPIVVQVSRWDRLKDPVGVLRGFAQHVAEHTAAHLVLAGPGLSGVADDPEANEVRAEVEEARENLPPETRARVHLASLPVEDDDENSAIVNAIQRRADVVVQKSLAEGFGLTVAEAMWKERPVVASKVGGIQDQVVDGNSGLLVDDPEDMAAFGRAVTGLLEDRERAERMGRAAHERVCTEFLPTRHLMQYVELLQRLRS
jgi:trehalose synthase